jgi:hypothetical protein
MATVYFVRDGTGNSATDPGREVSLAAIAKAFPNRKAIRSKDPPTFGGSSPASTVSDFSYVVIHIEGGEVAEGFGKDGYWYLDGVSPAELMRTIPQT